MTDRNAVNAAVRDDIGTMPDDPLADMLMEQNRETEPEPEVQPARLEFVEPDNYRFRTVVGLRSTEIRLRIAEESDDTDRNVKLKKAFEKPFRRQYGKDYLTELKPDKDLWERLGVAEFKFRPIPGRMEAAFETSDRRVAEYIRKRIAEPDYVGKIYEDVKPLAVELNGETVYVVPADAQSRTRMAAAAAGV